MDKKEIHVFRGKSANGKLNFKLDLILKLNGYYLNQF